MLILFAVCVVAAVLAGIVAVELDNNQSLSSSNTVSITSTVRTVSSNEVGSYITLQNEERTFFVNRLHSSDAVQNAVQQLKTGDEITLWIRAAAANSIAPSEMVEVCALSYGGRELLTLDEYMKAYKATNSGGDLILKAIAQRLVPLLAIGAVVCLVLALRLRQQKTPAAPLSPAYAGVDAVSPQDSAAAKRRRSVKVVLWVLAVLSFAALFFFMAMTQRVNNDKKLSAAQAGELSATVVSCEQTDDGYKIFTKEYKPYIFVFWSDTSDRLALSEGEIVYFSTNSAPVDTASPLQAVSLRTDKKVLLTSPNAEQKSRQFVYEYAEKLSIVMLLLSAAVFGCSVKLLVTGKKRTPQQPSFPQSQ